MSSRECEFCGEVFTINQFGSGGKGKIYCSPQCGYKAYHYRKLRKELGDTEEYRERLRRAKSGPRKLRNTEAAYLAGLIDGEGSISLFRRPSKVNKYGVNYQVYMLIVNTDKHLMEEVVKMVGAGSVQVQTKLDGRLGRNKWVYRYRIGPSDVRALLPQILPYLILKKPHAELVLKVANKIKAQQGLPHTRSFVDEMEQYVKKFRELHNKPYVPYDEWVN